MSTATAPKTVKSPDSVKCRHAAPFSESSAISGTRRQPQCRHTFASLSTSSAQSGHFTCVDEEGAFTLRLRLAHRKRPAISGLITRESKNHPIDDLPRVDARVATTAEKISQSAISAISISESEPGSGTVYHFSDDLEAVHIFFRHVAVRIL
jgi:hypothetical protein